MIRFPRMHIAQSVANRILNVANGVGQSNKAPPSLPEPLPMGQALDQALTTPPQPMAMPDGGEDAMTTAAMEGTSPAAAAAVQGVIEE